MVCISNLSLSLLILELAFVTLIFGQPNAQNGNINCIPTIEDVEGPYYVTDAPLTQNVLCTPMIQGRKLTVSGRVMDSRCQAGLPSTLDLWQADGNGNYSHNRANFFCRAKIRTDQNGYYTFTTVVPGHYGFPENPLELRPSHIHFKIAPSDTSYGTTTAQLYFKDDPFLGRKDMCSDCKSGVNSQQAQLSYYWTSQSYVATWPINLSKRFVYK